MAKENSFDIVSETDAQEVENAFNNAVKALKQRYDLKDSGAELSYDKASGTLVVLAPSDCVQLPQVLDILNTQLVRRKVDLKAVSWGKPEDASGSMIRTKGTIVQGIEQEVAKKISKDVRDQKFKVKIQIEGDKLRVSGPKRDSAARGHRLLARQRTTGLPLQFRELPDRNARAAQHERRIRHARMRKKRSRQRQDEGAAHRCWLFYRR